MVQGRMGSVRLGSFPTASQTIVPRALGQLSGAHEGLTVSLHEAEPGELAARLHNGDLDLALVFDYDLVPRRWLGSTERIPLLEEDVLLLVGDRGRGIHADPASRQSLITSRWISTVERTESDVFLSRLCATQGFEPRVSLRSNDYGVIQRFVQAGLGSALIPALGYTPLPGVSALAFPGAAAHRRVHIARRSSLTHPGCDALIQALRTSVDAAIERMPHMTKPAPGAPMAAL
jgi:DNA-binding transcriptional LysR family regulator